MAYAIRNDYRERSEAPRYFFDPPPSRWGPVWQPDVYRLAAFLGRRTNAQRLIDVGCGSGVKLIDAAGSRPSIGIDVGENLALCRDRWPLRDWRDVNLENFDRLPVETAELRGAVVIAADVIEHLVDPMPLIDALLAALAVANFVLLSTPDRERAHGASHLGPPPNPHHVREWTRAEFAGFLTDAGAQIGTIGWTRPNNFTLARTTILAVLAREPSLLMRSRVLPRQAARVTRAFYEMSDPGTWERIRNRRDYARALAIQRARATRDALRRMRGS